MDKDSRRHKEQSDIPLLFEILLACTSALLGGGEMDVVEPRASGPDFRSIECCSHLRRAFLGLHWHHVEQQRCRNGNSTVEPAV